MFSTTEYEYLNDIVNTYIHNNNYRYYLASTITPVQQGVTYDYDFYVLFSNDISINNYSFSVNDDYILCYVDSSNASYNNRLERLSCEYGSTLNDTLNNYESIYTNAANTIYPNLLSPQNHYSITNVLLCIIILINVFSKAFPYSVGD